MASTKHAREKTDSHVQLVCSRRRRTQKGKHDESNTTPPIKKKTNMHIRTPYTHTHTTLKRLISGAQNYYDILTNIADPCTQKHHPQANHRPLHQTNTPKHTQILLYHLRPECVTNPTPNAQKTAPSKRLDDCQKSTAIYTSLTDNHFHRGDHTKQATSLAS